MKLQNIKIKVETDEENQYILQQHIKLNKECAWGVDLASGYLGWFGQLVGSRYVCSVWKGFRHFIIDKDGDLIICTFEKHYNRREEKELTFDEFKAMCEPQDDIKVDGVKYKRIEE